MRNSGRPMTEEMMRLQALGLFHASPERFRWQGELVLRQAERLGDRYPELTVRWAMMVALPARLRGSPLMDDGIGLALAYAEAAYPRDPRGVRNSLLACHLATFNPKVRRYASDLAAKLEPQLQPGPWGTSEEGMAFLIAEQERLMPLSDRLRRWYVGITNPSRPDDLTIDR